MDDLKLIIVVANCPKCKMELRLSAAEVAAWCAGGEIRCPDCGKQPRPDMLILADVVGLNIGGLNLGARFQVSARPPEVQTEPVLKEEKV